MAVIPASHRLLEQGGFAQGLDGFTARARIPTEYQATGIASQIENQAFEFSQSSQSF